MDRQNSGISSKVNYSSAELRRSQPSAPKKLIRSEQTDSKTLLNEIAVQENQIASLSDKIIVQDQELKKLRDSKMQVDKLKALEDQLDKKDKTIAELKKKLMMAEEAI